MQCLLLGTFYFITHNAAANFPKAQIPFPLLWIKFGKAQSLQEATLTDKLLRLVICRLPNIIRKRAKDVG